MFELSEKLILEQSDEIFGVSQISWKNSSWKLSSLVNDEEVISLSHRRFLYSQILCYILERWIRTQHQILLGNSSWIGSRIHRNTELWTSLTENRWNSSGIFSQDSLHCSSSKKSKSSWTKWATQKIPRTNLSSCRCSMTSYGEIKTMKRIVLLIPHLCLYLQKDFLQDVGHSSDLDQKQSCILLTTKDHKENGTESLNWWWSNSENADTQSSEARVQCTEERSKEVENSQYTSVPMGIRFKLLFAQLFLLISSVSTEQSQICVMNTGPVKQERGDPYWQRIWPFVRASKVFDNDT